MSGIGFGEIILIVSLILLFFGSKELPRFLREAGTLMGRIRRYSDKVRQELDELARPEATPVPGIAGSAAKKQALRTQCLEARKNVSVEHRREKSKAIASHLSASQEYRDARSIMVYVSMGAEVDTRDIITQAMAEGKRVVIPYIKSAGGELGLGAIENIDTDTVPGSLGILEPVECKRDNFFKSDLQLIICPGVAFDRFGGRIGRGKSYYDRFLGELKGRIPLFALAFDCQILDQSVPFDYHDISMDQIITESGPVIKKEKSSG